MTLKDISILANSSMATKFSHSILFPYLQEAFRLLIEAYFDLCKLKIMYGDYNENKLKQDLVRYAERKKKKLGFRFVPERSDLQKNNRIDICIIYSLDLRFADQDLNIECKLLNYTNFQDYVNRNGIISFVNRKYSSKLPIAGMMGFVDHGEIPILITKINTFLSTHNSIVTKKLLTRKSIMGNYSETYYSNHERTGGKRPIRIYHVLLDYRGLVP